MRGVELEQVYNDICLNNFLHRVHPAVLVPQDLQDPSDQPVAMDQLVYEALKEHVVQLVPQDPPVNPDKVEMLVLSDYQVKEVMMVVMGFLVSLVREVHLVHLDSQDQLDLRAKTVPPDLLVQLVKMDAMAIPDLKDLLV